MGPVNLSYVQAALSCGLPNVNISLLTFFYLHEGQTVIMFINTKYFAHVCGSMCHYIDTNYRAFRGIRYSVK